MHAEVLKGQLIYIDTEEGQIQIMDEVDHQVTALNIDENTKLPANHSWERIVGDDIEAVVINGKTRSLYLLTEQM